MANVQNLKRGNKETEFESGQRAVECGRKGGKASQKKQKERKIFTESAKLLMGMDISTGNEKLKATLKKLGVTDESTSYGMAVTASMMNQAINGNVKAADWLVKMCGEEPSIEIQKLRVELERMRVEAEQDNGESIVDALKNVQTLAEIIGKPVANRDIEDYE